MDFSSDYKTKIGRIWAELLTIRQLAADSALWRAATYLSGKASDGYLGLGSDPFVEAILAQHDTGPDGLSGSMGAQAESGRARAERATHPQVPQAAWHKQRLRGTRLVRGKRGASHHGRRRPLR